MSHFKKYITELFIFWTLLLVGCNRDEFSLWTPDNTIAFRTETFLTRAASYSETGSNYYRSMGIYAAETTDDWTPTSPWNVFNNQKAEREQDNEWSYTPSKSWNHTRKYTFFAYAPHINEFSAGNLAISGSNGTPQLTFSVPDALVAQRDLLLAKALKNCTSTDADDRETLEVKLQMHHALTRISFEASASNPINTQANLKITKIEITGLQNQGSRPMDASAGIAWSTATAPQAGSTGNYTLIKTASGGLTDQALSNLRFENISDPAMSLFLMPQTITNNAKLKVTFGLYDKTTEAPFDPDGGGPLTAETIQTIRLADVIETFGAGEHITFIMNLSNPAVAESFKVTYAYKAWDDVNIDIDSDPNPFLDISNLTATTYDAAVTRIYFYTQINAGENVFIEPTGIATDGTSFKVNDEFVSLADAGATNFVYDNSTGKGYFDLINHPTGSAGTVDNQGKKQLIITLRSGKLRRTITVNPTVSTFASKNDALPYIGTFHRSDETGERIVTWHATGNWTATVNTTIGNHDQLLIDRMVSPAMINGSLYSDAPISAEGASVTDGGRSVSGSGRIYFRVGWKSIAPVAGNRYAMIKVVYNDGTIPNKEITLYCRQGEEPEQIAAASSLFSIYNINTPETFVEYPSQTGYLYQWNSAIPLSPVTEAIPAGFVTAQIVRSYDPNTYVCPDKYSHPDFVGATSFRNALGSTAIQNGYYADGYFDRRPVTNQKTGDNTPGKPMASSGWMFYNPINARAIFLPSMAYRDFNGRLLGNDNKSGYWTSLSGEILSHPFSASTNSQALGLLMQTGLNVNHLTSYDKRNAFSVRCMKLPGNTIYFDPNGGNFNLRSITSETTVTLPDKATVEASNNYRPNIEGKIFGGWKSSPQATTANYDGGATISAPSSDIYLYAHWVDQPPTYNLWKDIDPSILMFYSFSRALDIQNPTGTLIRYQNKITRSSKSEVQDVCSNEKAYPYLEFSQTVFDNVTVNEAINKCTGLEPANTWRVPKAAELAAISTLSSTFPIAKQRINAAVFSGKQLWSSSQSSDGKYLYGTDAGIPTATTSTTEVRSVRCVKELLTPPY